ncbi:MAG: family 16 glycosylhydrolase [Paludibacteraceae bacterium]|nr:family 16 glycosylhydrolase [Paludibacteraceae bacterium]
MKNKFLKGALVLSCLMLSTSLFAQYAGYTLVWQDEFNGGYSNADANGLDMDSWNYETGTGDGGWGTGQRDYSTTDRENVEVSGGTLKVRTQRNNPNQTHEYTSGRLNSKNKRAFLYGKMEARIRTENMTEPGRGFAFWMMPNALPPGTNNLMWPQGGEIDIFEYNGLYPRYNLGSVHYAWNWNNNGWGGDGNHAQASGTYNPFNRGVKPGVSGRDGCGGSGMTTEKTNVLGAEWHVYGINWFADRIEFYVDQDVYHIFYLNQNKWCGDEVTNAMGNKALATGWTFDENGFPENWKAFENPFYFIISAGVGGDRTYGGNITSGNNPDQWTCTTEIDWVRAYKYDNANVPVLELAYQKAGNTVVVTPTATSGNISKVEYAIDAIPVDATVTNNPYTYTFTPTANSHKIYARACSNDGYWSGWKMIRYSSDKDSGSTTEAVDAPCNYFDEFDLTTHIVMNNNWQIQNNATSTSTIADGTSFNNSVASGTNQWTYQLKLSSASRFNIEAGKTYHFSVDVTANNNISLIYKLTAGDNENNTLFDRTGAATAFTAGQKKTLTFDGVAGASLQNVMLVIGNGTQIPANTQIRIQNLSLIEDGCTEGGNQQPGVEKPAQPSVITQNPNTTPNVGDTRTYSVTQAGDVDTYNWVVTGGEIISGQGTNSITVRWTNYGNQSITVTPRNAGGNGPSRSWTVTIPTPDFDYWVLYKNDISDLQAAGNVLDLRTTFDSHPAWGGALQASNSANCDANVVCLTINNNGDWGGGNFTKPAAAYDFQTIKDDWVLHFKIKSTITGEIKINISGTDTTDEADIMFSTTSNNGYTGSGNWETVEIPLSDFNGWTNTNRGANYPLGFWDFNVAANRGKLFQLDDIYFYKPVENTCNLTAGITGVAQITCTTNPTLTVTSNETGLTYQWSNNATTSTIRPTVAGTYSVLVTNGSGCTASASVSITENKATPAITVGKSSNMSCNVRTVTLTVTSGTVGLTYNWSNTLGTSSRVTATTARTYTVSATNPANGCMSTATVNVSDNKETLNVSISGAGQLTCADNSLVLTASGTPVGMTYAWSNGGTTSTKTVNTAGGYTVTATYGVCTATRSVSVTQNSAVPAITAGKTSNMSCNVRTVTLTVTSGTAGLTYNWSNNLGTNSAVSASMARAYTVSATNPANGCSTSATVSVSDNKETVNVSINGVGQLTCANNSLVLTAAGTPAGMTYAWSNGGTTSTKTVSAAGEYTVTATYGVCSATKSVNITSDTNMPTIEVSKSNDITCNKQNATLSVSSNNANLAYSWSNGSRVATAVIMAANTYEVTATDTNLGCFVVKSIVVENKVTHPTVTIEGAQDLSCAVRQVELNAISDIQSPSYKWNNVAGNQTKVVNTIGAYTVKVEDTTNGCTASASAQINESLETIAPSIIGDTEINDTQKSLTLSVEGMPNGVTYTWSNGGSASTQVVTDAGNYSVEVNYGVCVGSASVMVTSVTTVTNPGDQEDPNDNPNDNPSNPGTSVSESDLSVISMYPNPVSDVLNVVVNIDSKIISAALYDMSGKKVKELNLTTGVNQVSMSDLTKGVYVIVIKTSDALIRERIILQ